MNLSATRLWLLLGFPLLSLLVTFSAHIYFFGPLIPVKNLEGTRRQTVQRQEEEQKNDMNASPIQKEEEKEKKKGMCDSWPLSRKSMPLGDSLTTINDLFNIPCQGKLDLLRNTFSQSFHGSGGSTSKRNMKKFQIDSLFHIDCETIPPSTLYALVRLNDKHPQYDAIRTCASQRYTQSNNNNSASHADGAPFITLRSLPKANPRGSELSFKDKLPDIMEQYAPCQHSSKTSSSSLDSCIIPKTFHISDNETECISFFDTYANEQSSINSTKRSWVIKPIGGKGGSGIERLSDVHKQLGEYSMNCAIERRRKRLDPIVIQQYIKPWLIMDGRSFHVRLYLLFKFGSKPHQHITTNQSKSKKKKKNSQQQQPFSYDDPPMAWHIHVGNIHLCSEPYSKIDSKLYGKYAVKCNGLAWEENPRIQKEEKKNKQRNYDFYRPYPQYLKDVIQDQTTYDQLQQRFDTLLHIISKVVHGKALETNTYPMAGESLWTVMGIDLLIDDNFKPWLLEINACPGNPLYEKKFTELNTMHRNPYISIYRIIFSHYKRYLMNDFTFDEASCLNDGMGNNDDELLQPLITKVF